MEYDKINNLLSSLELSEDNEMSEQGRVYAIILMHIC